MKAGGACWQEASLCYCLSASFIKRLSLKISRMKLRGSGRFSFRVIQESEVQADLFCICQIQDEITVGHKVKIEPAWVNKAARQDSINFCSADGALGLKL